MSTKVAKQKPQATLKDMLQGDGMRKQFEVALPRHLTPERFIRVATTALLKTPQLADCNQASFFECLLALASHGLEPDGRRAHLIPFRNNKAQRTDCQLIIDYKGLVELAKRSGNVATIHADIVCDGDQFIWNKGRVEKHEIDFRSPRGKMFAAYAMCVMKDGSEQAVCLQKEEIDAVRKQSRAGTSGPWKTHYEEMAKKTAFRRLSKWLTLSPEFMNAVALDDDPRLSADVIDTVSQSVAQPKRLSEVVEEAVGEPDPKPDSVVDDALASISSATSIDDLNERMNELTEHITEWPPEVVEMVQAAFTKRQDELTQ